MPTLVVVLDSRRIVRALGVEEHELPRVRRELQAWLDARAWVLEANVVRELGARGRDDAPSVRSVAWQICGPTIFASEATRWVLPGEAHLIDANGARWRLPPEHVDAMGFRRILREATLATGVSRRRAGGRVDECMTHRIAFGRSLPLTYKGRVASCRRFVQQRTCELDRAFSPQARERARGRLDKALAELEQATRRAA